MRGSVWVPICDSIVIARLQLHILDTLSFSLMELLFSLIVVPARHVSEECILWNSDPSCKYRMKTSPVSSWKMLVPVNLDGVATKHCCSCLGVQFLFVRFPLLEHQSPVVQGHTNTDVAPCEASGELLVSLDG